MTGGNFKQKSIWENLSGSVIDQGIEPPGNAKAIFSEYLTKMQNEIREENKESWYVVIYSLTIFLHIFPDGNGRTSRFIYQFLSSGETKQSTSVNSPKQSIRIPTTLNTYSVLQLFEELELIPKFRNSNGNTDDEEGELSKIAIKEYLDTRIDPSGCEFFGTNTDIKYLAALRMPGRDKSIRLKITNDVLKTEEYQRSYSEIYKMQLDEIIKLIMENSDMFIKMSSNL